MKMITKLSIGVMSVVALLGGALGMRRVREDRRYAEIKDALQAAPPSTVFSESLVTTLPAPARRYFRHAIAPGTLLAPTARLTMSGEMAPKPGSPRLRLTAREVLTPSRGFVWTARFQMGPVPGRVVDHYFQDRGGLCVEALGLVPIQTASGADITRSARGRTAAEALWVPASLLPGPDVTWEAVDDHHARVIRLLDGEAISMTFEVDEAGRLRSMTMARYGNVGVETFQPLPYGFAVEAEGTFGGYTIPTKLRGGWWYGTDRYDPSSASLFEVQEAIFLTHAAEAGDRNRGTANGEETP